MTVCQITPICSAQPNSWAIPDVPSDILIEVDGVSYALHKFPLVARCGLLRMLVANEKEDTSRVELEGVPGGAEGFELAAKFCYGVCLQMSKNNIAILRCVAEFLDMSEEYAKDNLVSQTEAYLERLGKQHLKDIVATLVSCENLLPLAEELNIVSRCVDWAAVKALQEKETHHQSLSTFHEYQDDSSKAHIDWWVEDLSVLRIDFYQRVLAAMKAKGLTSEGIGGALVYYAHQSLKGLTKKRLSLLDPGSENPRKVHDASTAMKHEQRMLVETIVSLIPREKQVVSISFLIGLLRIACILETTLACRLDLEKRIGIQLHRATLEDLLIPSLENCGGSETLFDVDIVHRLFVSCLEQKDEDDMQLESMSEENEGFNSPSQHPMLKVGKLLDAYLTEIASDANLSPSKFADLAKLLPDHARPVEDGLYKAIDAFLKAHPSMTDMDRKKLCRLLEFQKLSQEACVHAAQNERLPVQAVVQVLFVEQLRIRNVMAEAACHSAADTQDLYTNSTYNRRLNLQANHSPHNDASALTRLKGATLSVFHKDHYASVRRENRELKLEVARMKMRLSELEKDHQKMKQDMEKGHTAHTHHHHHGFMHAVSKSISKLNPFHQNKLNSIAHDLRDQGHKFLSQPEPQRRTLSASSRSSKASTKKRLSVS